MPLSKSSSDNSALWAALLDLQPGQRVRIYRAQTDTKWQDAVWVFRDTLDLGTNTATVEYFADGEWHETREGVGFDTITPWQTR